MSSELFESSDSDATLANFSGLTTATAQNIAEKKLAHRRHVQHVSVLIGEATIIIGCLLMMVISLIRIIACKYSSNLSTELTFTPSIPGPDADAKFIPDLLVLNTTGNIIIEVVDDVALPAPVLVTATRAKGLGKPSWKFSRESNLEPLTSSNYQTLVWTTVFQSKFISWLFNNHDDFMVRISKNANKFGIVAQSSRRIYIDGGQNPLQIELKTDADGYPIDQETDHTPFYTVVANSGESVFIKNVVADSIIAGSTGIAQAINVGVVSDMSFYGDIVELREVCPLVIPDEHGSSEESYFMKRPTTYLDIQSNYSLVLELKNACPTIGVMDTFVEERDRDFRLTACPACIYSNPTTDTEYKRYLFNTISTSYDYKHLVAGNPTTVVIETSTFGGISTISLSPFKDSKSI